VWYARRETRQRYLVSTQLGCPAGASTDEIVFPKSGITKSGLVLVPAGSHLQDAIDRGMADFRSPRPYRPLPASKRPGDKGFFRAQPFTQR